MKKYILELIFDERTGECKIVVDFQDESMTALEINESIHSGDLRDELLGVVENMFGEQIACNVRAGKTAMICQDDEQATIPQTSQQKISQENTNKKENLL